MMLRRDEYYSDPNDLFRPLYSIVFFHSEQECIGDSRTIPGFLRAYSPSHQHPRCTRCFLLPNRYSDSSLASLGSTTTGRYVLDFSPTDRWPLNVRFELEEAESISSHVSLFAVATLQLRSSEHDNFSTAATAEQI